MEMKGAVRAQTLRSILDNLAARERDVRAVALRATPLNRRSDSGMSATAKQRANETIVLMPFYGVSVGNGHSVVSTRFAYLNLT